MEKQKFGIRLILVPVIESSIILLNTIHIEKSIIISIICFLNKAHSNFEKTNDVKYYLYEINKLCSTSLRVRNYIICDDEWLQL